MKHKEAIEKFEEEIILKLVNQIRRSLPRLGGRKLFYLLKEDLNGLPSRPGRDKFFDILRKNGLLIKPIKQYAVTTNSRHIFRIHSNLIRCAMREKGHEGTRKKL
ncbi:MAG TPA: hypothetical protein VKD08_14310 [Ignavibacteriaceae bacterium]|jgi:putative transposase|nr:hypothetical protein [Ignavibacteriaceae bacterium]